MLRLLPRSLLPLLLLLSLGRIGKTLSIEDFTVLIAMVENAIFACGAFITLPPLAV